MRWSVPAALLLAGACSAPPEILPPVTAVGDAPNIRLFYPTGIAATPGGDLIVANSNFDHSFDAGSLVTIRHGLFVDHMTKAAGLGLDCSKLVVSDTDPDPQHAKFARDCDFQIGPERFAGSGVVIGNYAGPLMLDTRVPPAGQIGVAYTGSRDTNALNRVLVAGDGSLSCVDGAPDCRATSIDMLAKATLEGPYSIVPGVTRIPGEAQDRQVVYVAALVPHIDAINGGTAYTSASIAALDAADPTNVRFGMLASSQFVANGIGTGPMIFDPVSRQLYLSGCYQRFGASAAGDPTTGKCSGITNSLRILDVDSAAASNVRIYDLTTNVRGAETVALALGDPEPSGTRTIWATMRNADALVQLTIPSAASGSPQVLRAIPLPLSPADVKLIPRPGKLDLVAVAAAHLGSVMIYDPSSDQVVAQIERLGDTPWKLDLIPGAPAGHAWLVASVFGSCRIAMMDISLDQPWNSVLRGRAGTCP